MKPKPLAALILYLLALCLAGESDYQAAVEADARRAEFNLVMESAE